MEEAQTLKTKLNRAASVSHIVTAVHFRLFRKRISRLFVATDNQPSVIASKSGS
jgi:hypothetical protein